MNNQLPQKLSILYTSKIFPRIIIFIGIVLRFIEYLHNRSLYDDEAKLALNIVNRSFSELLQPLDYVQIAPIGFLMLEKLIVQVFKNSEYVLRLLPFLCGIISLFLFYKISIHYIKPKAIPIALGLFAISQNLIYYSTELKQYSSDVTIALLLYLVTTYIQSKDLTIPVVVLYGIFGAIAIWFSNTSVFILAGIGTSLALFCLVGVNPIV